MRNPSYPPLHQVGVPERPEVLEPASDELVFDFLALLDEISLSRYPEPRRAGDPNPPVYEPFSLDGFTDYHIQYQPWLPNRPGELIFEHDDFVLRFRIDLDFPYTHFHRGQISEAAPPGSDYDTYAMNRQHGDMDPTVTVTLLEASAKSGDPQVARSLVGLPKDHVIAMVRQLMFRPERLNDVIDDPYIHGLLKHHAQGVVEREERRNDEQAMDDVRMPLRRASDRTRRAFFAPFLGMSERRLERCVECAQAGGPRQPAPKIVYRDRDVPVLDQWMARKIGRRSLLKGAAAVGVPVAAELGYEVLASRKGLWSPLRWLMSQLYDESEQASGGYLAPTDPDDAFERRVSRLEIPEGISDTGLILYTSSPISDGETKEVFDTILDVDALSKHFFRDHLQMVKVAESCKTWQGKKERCYHLTIPGEETGEVLNGGRGKDQMKNTTWSDVLNLITRAAEVSDGELIGFLTWWYKKTYNIQLDPQGFEVVRGEGNSIDNIFYRGANKDAEIDFQEAEILDRVPATSARARRNTYTVSKRFTSERDSRLLLWTGVGQDLVIPESFLIGADHHPVTLDLIAKKKGFEHTEGPRHTQDFGQVRFNWSVFADTIRNYVEHRDDGQTFTYNDPRTDSTGRWKGLENYVVPDDPVVKRIVRKILKGAKSQFEIADRIRRYFQHQTEYDKEAGDEVNRPTSATIMQGWGDCNNLTVGAASLFKAAGIRTALVYAVNDPDKLHTIKKRWRRSTHVLLAVHKDDLAASGITYQAWSTGGKEPEDYEWVLFDPNSKTNDFGDFPLGKRMNVVEIREIQ